MESEIYVVSTAGHPNYGDEVITEGWLRFLARTRPEATVWLDCPQPGRASILFAGIHGGLRTTNTLWQLSERANGDDRAAAHAEARRLVAERGTPREDLGLEVLASADLIHMIGGGYLAGRWPANLLLPTLVSEAVRRSGRRAVMTGTGLLPIDDADTAPLREALDDFAFVDVRDASSAATFGVPQGTDDAFLALASAGARFDRRPAPRAMLLLQGDIHDPTLLDSILTRSLEALREAGLEGEQLGVVEAIAPDDAWPLARIREEWSDVRFFPFAEVWKEGLAAREDQVWVSTRFHAHLLAATQGARGIAIDGGDDYYRIKHASLTDVGTGWTVVSGSDAAPWAPPAVAHDFVERSLGLAADRMALARDLYAR
ncbi:polysaccharide pyruvyl transferase family protein [Demequina sp. NBRC 110057]|uniref:polysaccharide pyruvyl transferase family protein n=1 Tax=Demequina sp. NBRC 110057 TaxID=1570346 RepID=UPI000A0219AB|nr:polysaccharide pyruvyl transferase family protein [Demequina sp. NBRC 110057]